MTIRKYVLSIAVILMMSCAVSSQRLAGVWRLASVTTTGPNGKTSQSTQPSMYLFTGTHLSTLIATNHARRTTRIR